jgi:hypothetical protein
MRVTSGSWDGAKVILRDQALEVRCVDGRLHIVRKPRGYDEWDHASTIWGNDRQNRIHFECKAAPHCRRSGP